MKVIKRDGTIVDYDKEKIFVAIGKANDEVLEEERATDEEIKKIVKYIESLNKKRILVEDIQDLIELKLMEMKRFELAKHYIVYRYRRALVRKSNTTDESILRLIRNNQNNVSNDNSNSRVASIQRNYIASEVSSDLTKRVLLRNKIVEAHENGVIHFHNMDYFIHPVFNSSLVDIEDMLDNGTVINGVVIDTPKSFRVAAIVLAQIIENVLANQYGGVSIDLRVMGKYLRKSKEKIKEYISSLTGAGDKLIEFELLKELKDGIQTILYQLSTFALTNNDQEIILFMYLDDKDEYKYENAIIYEELLKQSIKGIKIVEENKISKIVYVLDKNNNLNGGDYDYLTRLAMETNDISFISAKIMRELYDGNVFSPMGSRLFLSPYKDETGKYKWTGRFNLGVVTINLPQIGIIADGDEEVFWNVLDERLDLVREALMLRYHALLGGTSDISPIHWQYGAITRLDKNEKLDRYVENGFATLAVGYIGLYELTRLMTGVSQSEDMGTNFALKVLKHMSDKCLEWKNETGLAFVLYGTPDNDIKKRFTKIDLDKFGKIKDITDKGYYTDSYHLDYRESINNMTKLDIERKFQNISIGGSLSFINMDGEKINDELVKYIFDNVLYVEIK